MDYKKYFVGKKVTVMGLGLLGRGLGVIKFLAENGAKITVTDLKSKEELKTSIDKLKKFKKIKYVLGEHRLEDFRDKDFVVRAPNAPLDSPYLAEARKNNVPIEMDASLFARLAPTGVKIIGVTGTRGKSTVTHLLFEILQKTRQKDQVFLAGNVRGTATLPLLKKVRPGDMVVMELDSWQLQGFGDSKISPHIAVFTAFMNDHMNYYKNNMEQYFADKANIFKYQKAGDILIVGKQVAPKISDKRKIIAKPLPKNWKLKIRGEHNRYNAGLAVETARQLGVPEGKIKRITESFSGLSGRLEFVRKVGGVEYYNDTTATSPDALKASLKAFTDKKGKIVLLAGGTDANLDFTGLGKEISKYVKAVIFFKGTATDKILEQLTKKPKFKIELAGSMKEALKYAQAYAGKNDIVLLSPGAKSFGPPPGGFKNEFDRGDQFVKQVKKLK